MLVQLDDSMSMEEYNSKWQDLVQTDLVLTEMFENGSIIQGKKYQFYNPVGHTQPLELSGAFLTLVCYVQLGSQSEKNPPNIYFSTIQVIKKYFRTLKIILRCFLCIKRHKKHILPRK